MSSFLDKEKLLPLIGASVIGAVVGFLGSQLFGKGQTKQANNQEVYSIADQVARFQKQKKNNCQRALNIDKFFDGSKFEGKRVLVVGSTRGLGLAIIKELVNCKAQVIATCRKVNDDLKNAKVQQIITDIEVTDLESVKKLQKALTEPLDVVICNAGYFPDVFETIDKLNFEEEIKQIDICALGCLRVASVLFNANLIKNQGKIALISSQAGSIDWRGTQNPKGGDYGHHMSRAATNIMGKLLSQELKGKASVSILHPGFNKTDMTRKFSHIWDQEGAVETSIGAKRTLHEINNQSIEKTGLYINCEDGLLIPW